MSEESYAKVGEPGSKFVFIPNFIWWKLSTLFVTGFRRMRRYDRNNQVCDICRVPYRNFVIRGNLNFWLCFRGASFGASCRPPKLLLSHLCLRLQTHSRPSTFPGASQDDCLQVCALCAGKTYQKTHSPSVIEADITALLRCRLCCGVSEQYHHASLPRPLLSDVCLPALLRAPSLSCRLN